MEIALIFNSSGKNDVLQSLDDTEIVDAVLQGLEGDNMNVEEDLVEKEDVSVGLASTKEQLRCLALMKQIPEDTGLTNEPFLAKIREMQRFLRA